MRGGSGNRYKDMPVAGAEDFKAEIDYTGLGKQIPTPGTPVQGPLQEIIRYQKRIAELEKKLADMKSLADFWISKGLTPNMCEQDYNTWLALGYRSKAMIAASQEQEKEK